MQEKRKFNMLVFAEEFKDISAVDKKGTGKMM